MKIKKAMKSHGLIFTKFLNYLSGNKLNTHNKKGEICPSWRS